jgi:hypothetical protein
MLSKHAKGDEKSSIHTPNNEATYNFEAACFLFNHMNKALEIKYDIYPVNLRIHIAT